MSIIVFRNIFFYWGGGCALSPDPSPAPHHLTAITNPNPNPNPTTTPISKYFYYQLPGGYFTQSRR